MLQAVYDKDEDVGQDCWLYDLFQSRMIFRNNPEIPSTFGTSFAPT